MSVSHRISANRFESLTDHELAYDVFHKLVVLDWRGAASRLTDLSYIEERCRRGQVAQLLRDYQRALSIADIRVPGFTAGFEDEREIGAYVQRLSEFCKHSQNREKGHAPIGMETQNTSCPTLSPGSRVIRRRGRHGYAGPNVVLRRRLLETAQWLRDNLSGLQEYGTHPGYCAQEALNWSRDRIFRRHAHRSMVDRRAARPYLLANRTPTIEAPNLTLLGRLQRHQSLIRCAVVSPDASFAITGGDDCRVCIWDFKSGVLVREFIDVPDRVFSMAMSLNGRMLVTGLADGSLALWCLKSSRLVHHRRGHEGITHAVAVTADGGRILSGGEDGSVLLWDGITAEILHREGDLGPGPVRAIGLSADGATGLIGYQTLVERKRIDSLRLFRAHADEHFSMLHTGVVNKSVAVSPDGSLGISTGHNFQDIGRLYGWDLRHGKQLWESEEQPCAIEAIAMTLDTKEVLFLRADGVLARWDIARRRCTHRARLGVSTADVIACSATGRVAVTVDGFPGTAAHVWDPSTLPEAGEPPSSAARTVNLVLLRRERSVITCNNKGLVSVSGRRVAKRVWQSTPDSGHFGRFFIDATEKRILLHQYDEPGYQVVDLEKGTCENHNRDDSKRIKTLAATPTFSYIVAGYDDGTLRIANPKESTHPRDREGHHGKVNRVIALPCSRYAISVGKDRAIRRWDLDSTDCCMTIPLHHDEELLGTTVDGEYAVTKTRDIVRFRNMFHASLPIDFECDLRRNNGITLTPDGRAFVAEESASDGGCNLVLWDVKSRHPLRTLAYHEQGFTYRQISYDARFIVVADLDDFLRVVELETGKLVCIHQMHTPLPIIAGPSADGTIAIGVRQGPVRVIQVQQLAFSAPFVTGTYEWQVLLKREGQWDNRPTVRCPWCNWRGPAPSGIVKATEAAGRSAGKSGMGKGAIGAPTDAWNEVRLRTRCVWCRRPLRYNPFIVDHRDQKLGQPSNSSGLTARRSSSVLVPEMRKAKYGSRGRDSAAGPAVLLHTKKVANLRRVISILETTSWFDWPTDDDKACCEYCGTRKSETGLWLGKRRICTDCARNCFDAIGDSLIVGSWRATHISDALSPTSPLHARLAVLRRFDEIWRQADRWTTAERHAVFAELIGNMGYQGKVFGSLVRELAVDCCSKVGEPLLSQLLTMWKPDPWQHLVNSAIVAITVAPESFDVQSQLNQMLYDPRPQVREFLCVALGRKEADWTRWYLMKLARDPEDAVRDEAQCVLDRWESRAGILRDEEIESRDRLESFLGSGDPVLRKHAIMSLANMRCTWSRLRLLRAVTEGREAVRSDIQWFFSNPYRRESNEDQLAVIEAAGRFDGPRIDRQVAEETDRIFGPALELLHDDKNPK